MHFGGGAGVGGGSGADGGELHVVDGPIGSAVLTATGGAPSATCGGGAAAGAGGTCSASTAATGTVTVEGSTSNPPTEQGTGGDNATPEGGGAAPVYSFTDTCSPYWDVTATDGAAYPATLGASATFTRQDQPNVTVTFNSQGGSAVAAVTLTRCALLSQPANPTRAGFQFLQWFRDSGATLPFTFGTEIRDDLTLFAGWTAAAAPTILTQPEGGELTGETFELTSTASGSPDAPTVQWQFQESPDATKSSANAARPSGGAGQIGAMARGLLPAAPVEAAWQDVPGATSTTLLATEPGYYRAVFTNSLGTLESNAALVYVVTESAGELSGLSVTGADHLSSLVWISVLTLLAAGGVAMAGARMTKRRSRG